MYFKCSVVHEEMGDAGKIKKDVTHYLVSAVNYTEAETRITQTASEYFRDFKVDKVVKTKILQVVSPETAGMYYDVKIRQTLLDEDSGTEKTLTTEYLVDADDINHAIAVTSGMMEDNMILGEIISAVLTSITEVIDDEVTDVFPRTDA